MVADDSGQPVAYASVLLMTDGQILAGRVTDKSGGFVFRTQPGKFLLVAEGIGFVRTETPVELTSRGLDVGTIVLKQSVEAISEVVVTAASQPVRHSVDRTTIGIEENISASKGSVLEVLRTSPAVSVGADMDITVRGKGNVLILMDGVPQTVTDLESVPASQLKSIEIITNPDASYDSGGTGGIINMVSRRHTAGGVSGIVGANYGFNHFVNGNFSLALNSERISWRINGTARYEDDIKDGTLFREFCSSGRGILQQIHSRRNSSNSNFGVGMTFRPGSRNEFSADVKAMFPRFNTRQNFDNDYFGSGEHRYESRTADVTWNRENLDIVASWRHKLRREASRFTLGANVSKIWGHRPSSYSLEGEPVGKSKSGGSPFLSSLSGDFSFGLKPGTLDFGARFTYRSNNQFSEFFVRESQGWIPSPDFSASLKHRELVPALYAMFSSKPSSKFSYKVGLRGEYSLVRLMGYSVRSLKDKRDLFIAPSLSFEYRPSKAHTLSLSYGRRVGRPTYPQLNPYMSVIDATTFEQGNPELDAEKADNLDISYSVKSSVFSAFVNLYLNHTKDYITQVSSLSENDGLRMTYINCDSDVRTGLDLTLKLSAAKWLDATLSSTLLYADTRGDFDAVDINNRGWAGRGSLLVDVRLSASTRLQVQYFLDSPQHYPQFTTSLNHYMNIAFRQTLLKGALTLNASLEDVFATDRWKIHSENRIFTLRNTSRRKSRMFWLGMTYNFNSFKPVKNSKKQEMNRGRLDVGL